MYLKYENLNFLTKDHNATELENYFSSIDCVLKKFLKYGNEYMKDYPVFKFRSKNEIPTNINYTFKVDNLNFEFALIEKDAEPKNGLYSYKADRYSLILEEPKKPNIVPNDLKF